MYSSDMLAFISHIAIMLSLAVILYLIAKTLPSIDDKAPKSLSLKKHWATNRIEQIDHKVKVSSEKILRRFGIVLLKWENKVNKKVKHLKEESGKTGSDILQVESKPEEKKEEASDKKLS